MEMLEDNREYWETYDSHIAFYKYGVKAIWFMFAVLKELSGFIYPICAVKAGGEIQEIYWVLKKMWHFNCGF